MKCVSIIIPVYNTEKFVIESLNSVLNQTYQNLEIIIINDGSTDNSLQLINEYSKKDARIKIFDKKHTGVSNSRNLGLKKMNGEYVTFLDSDDKLTPDYIETMVNYLEKYNLDVVKTGFTMFDSKHQEKVKLFDEKYKKIDVKQLNNLFLQTSKLNPSCEQLIKYNIIKENNLKYNEDIGYAEDFLFNYNLFTKCKNIGWINHCGYLCRKNENSSSRIRKFSVQYKNAIDALLAFQVLYDGTNNNQVSNKILNVMINQFKISNIKNITLKKFKKDINKIYSLKEWEAVIKNFKSYETGSFFNKFLILFFKNRHVELFYLFLKMYLKIKKGD